MTGFLNLAYPLFDTIDSFLPLAPVFRVMTFGAIAGILAMLVYWMASSQARIKAQQAEMAAIRAQLKEAEHDFAETMRLSKRNLKASFKLLGIVLGPGLLSALPVLFVMAWVAARFSYELPAPGTSVPFEPEPNIAIAIAPPTMRSGEIHFSWPAPDETVVWQAAGAEIYTGPPSDVASPVVHKSLWWNALLGNEAGYLDASAPIEALRFELADMDLLGFGPGWMRGWIFVFIVATVVASLVVKFAFRIA